MLTARHTLAAATASLLIAGACLVPTQTAQAQPPAACANDASISLLASPLSPWKGAALRVVLAAEKPLEGEFSLVAPDGTVAATSRDRHGGPPYFWYAAVEKPAEGTWHAKLTRDGATGECASITREVAVLGKEPPRPGATKSSVWPIRRHMEPLD